MALNWCGNADRPRHRTRMAANNAKIVVAELNAEAGQQSAQIVSQAGGECIAVRTDVSQEDSVRAATETAVQHYGGLHVLHNNAGGSTPADNTVVEAPPPRVEDQSSTWGPTSR